MDWKKGFIIRPKKARKFIVYKDKKPVGTCDENSAAIYLRQPGYQIIEMTPQMEEMVRKEKPVSPEADSNASLDKAPELG